MSLILNGLVAWAPLLSRLPSQFEGLAKEKSTFQSETMLERTLTELGK